MKIFHFYFFFGLVCASATLDAQPILTAQDKGDKLLWHPAAASIRSGNAVIAVQVNDTLGGIFNPHKGLFNIGTADNRPLLFKFPQELYTSYLNVRVDGTVHSNNPFLTNVQTLPAASNPERLSDGTIICSYRVGNIAIEQRLKPEQYTSLTGAIRIQYLITNNDVSTHQIGLLLLLDTNINDKDDARVWTSFGYRQGEHHFVSPMMPDYFQAFERTDLDSTGLVAQGTLVGGEAVRPDLLVISDWNFLNDVVWDYTPQQLPFYNDSAVLLRWNEQRLAAGEKRLITTYYGLGDVSTQSGPLTLTLTAPTRLDAIAGQLTPNPFDVNLIVQNNGFVAATDLRATLILPRGLELPIGESASK
ncbi:MAG: hypothetical protein ONA90_02960, partial [candidate division KSB1 bacterium]|nr:hypothetical protein [candidate division KSB1 bacterium]